MKNLFRTALLLCAASANAATDIVPKPGNAGNLGASDNPFPYVISQNLVGVTTNEIIVSPRGITNGLSTLSNAGFAFGPDTPGTTTSGLQEAINAFNDGSQYGPGVASLSLRLAPGDFYYTNQIVYSNNYTYDLTIQGSGRLSTRLIYAGVTTVTNCFFVTGGGNPDVNSINRPGHVTISDATFTSLNNSTNVLLQIKSYSDLVLSRLNFTSWQIMTNTPTGSAVSIVANQLPAGYVPGLVGYYIDSPSLEHGTTLSDIYHAGLAVGGRVSADHVNANGLKFAWISKGLEGATNQWATNAVYYIGACIIAKGGYDSSWVYGHCYGAKAGFVGNGLTHDPALYNWHFETVDFPIASDRENAPTLINAQSTTGNLADFKQLVLRSPQGAPASYATNYYYLTTTDHNYSSAWGSFNEVGTKYDFYVRKGNSLTFYARDSLLFADGSELFNLNGSSIASGTVDPARLGSGSSITTKFLRGDSTWQTISGGGDALTSGTLAQFSATTSAQLRGVLTDEEGTGVFLTANGSGASLTGLTIGQLTQPGLIHTNGFTQAATFSNSVTVWQNGVSTTIASNRIDTGTINVSGPLPGGVAFYDVNGTTELTRLTNGGAWFSNPVRASAFTNDAATASQLAVYDANKRLVSANLSGDVVTSGSTATIQANSVALGTDTTGNYAASDAEAGGATKLTSAAGTATLSASGDVSFNTTDKQLGIYNGSKEVAIPTILHKMITFDPKAVCDGAVDRLFIMKLGIGEPKGIHILAWSVSFEADPTTEVDLDLKRADAFIGVANSAVMDVLDTTAGVSSESTSSNINSDAVVANGKVIYLEFGTAYTETTHQIIFDMWYELEED